MPDNRLQAARHAVKGWLPAVLWAGLIFFFSTDLFSGAHTGGIIGPWMRFFFPEMASENIELAHFLVRKLGHLTEYFILATLLMRALRQENGGRLKPRHLLISFALATIYAISDEFHQSFVPSRGASIVDVVIDMCGAAAGIFWSHRRNRHKNTLPGAASAVQH